MRMKKLGNTGLIVSDLCLGTMTFGPGVGRFAQIGHLDQRTVDDIVQTAIDRGINFIDTADVYHLGQSEIMTGQALRNLGVIRQNVVVATKVLGRMGVGPNHAGLSRVHIMNAIDASLTRLKLDHVDLYQIHGADPLTPLEETLDALNDCVRAGKVRYIGLCNLPAWQIAKSMWISDRQGLKRFESVQAYYSIAGRDLEREIIPLALDQKLAVLPWSPLAGGLLSGKYTRNAQGPQGSRRTTFDFPPVDRERAFKVIEAMQPMATRHGVSVARVALAWLLHQPAVTSVIIGARTREQLEDNVGAAKLRLDVQELAELAKVSALPPEYPGWMVDRQSGERRETAAR
jgi:aryl-alcohol dehydrogenase-like predicted oxidoreductase